MLLRSVSGLVLALAFADHFCSFPFMFSRVRAVTGGFVRKSAAVDDPLSLESLARALTNLDASSSSGALVFCYCCLLISAALYHPLSAVLCGSPALRIFHCRANSHAACMVGLVSRRGRRGSQEGQRDGHAQHDLAEGQVAHGPPARRRVEVNRRCRRSRSHSWDPWPDLERLPPFPLQGPGGTAALRLYTVEMSFLVKFIVT